jgi:hypothetical protein
LLSAMPPFETEALERCGADEKEKAANMVTCPECGHQFAKGRLC